MNVMEPMCWTIVLPLTTFRVQSRQWPFTRSLSPKVAGWKIPPDAAELRASKAPLHMFQLIGRLMASVWRHGTHSGIHVLSNGASGGHAGGAGDGGGGEGVGGGGEGVGGGGVGGALGGASRQ